MKKLTKYGLFILFVLSIVGSSWAQCLITVTTPQGGANLGCGNNTITWTSSNTSGFVKIEYYCDGSWTMITSITSDDGSYTWNIPSGTCCETARIRITDYRDNCTDTGDDFSINCGCQCQITVTAPTIGENLDCSPYEIHWTSQNTSGEVRIEYFCDGTYYTITPSTPDDGSYLWTIPSGLCCQDAKIRIKDAIDYSCIHQSPSFTINCDCGCQINVTSPTAGDTIGCDHTITWTSQGTSGNVQIEFYCDGDWHPIVFNTPDDGSYDWVDFYPLNGCCDSTLIRVSDALDLQCFGIGGPFIFDCECQCLIEVTSPVAGDTIGCDHTITWTSQGTSGNVQIEYYCNGDWHPIVFNTPDDGSYDWVDFYPPTGCCDSTLIRVSDALDLQCYGIDGPFVFNCECCKITVTYPNGGEIILCDSLNYITWDSEHTSGVVMIEYFCDTLWHVITPATQDDGNYTWAVFPDSLTDSTCCDTAFIKITDVQNPFCYDFSDSAFTIICGCDSCCTIKVISPNGGENLGCGNYKIVWQSYCTSGKVKIQYYCDGTWQTIVSSTPDDGSYIWTIPANTCCENAKIRIIDVIYSYCYDMSDGYFTIECECDDWFFKKGDGDSIKYGISEFDQKQDTWQTWRTELIAANVWTYCGPVAAANCLWWYDSRIEADYGHEVDLVKAYGSWDDKNTSNVKPFVEDLARRCRTNMSYPWLPDQPRLGTDLYDMRVGINSLLYESKLDTFLYVHKEKAPLWDNVIEELGRCQDVILLLGIYGENENTHQWERIGGHYVTMAGFNSTSPQWIGISDPFLDHAEGDQGIGSPPHDPYVHNNSNIISGPHGTDIHDPYRVDLTQCTPYATWKLPTYKISGQMFTNFLHQNQYRPSLYTIPAFLDTIPSDTICVNPEYALYVSPYEGNLGSIGGEKTDQDGNYLEGWEIKLKNSNGNLLDVTFTDIAGRFIFGGLTPGSYIIEEGNVSGWQGVSPVGGKYTVTLNPKEHIRDLVFVNLFEGIGIDEQFNKQSQELQLERNYPNPFNSSTVIKFYIPKSTSISLKIYNYLGQEIKTLFEGFKNSGTYQLTWDGANSVGETVSNGIYFVKLKNDTETKTIKIMLIQ